VAAEHNDLVSFIRARYLGDRVVGIGVGVLKFDRQIYGDGELFTGSIAFLSRTGTFGVGVPPAAGGGAGTA